MQRPDEVSLLRRCLLCASSWTYLRFSRRFASWPWQAAKLVDSPLSAEVRSKCLQELQQARSCCLDAGFTRRLQHRVLDGEQLMSVTRQHALFAWANSVTLSTTDVELRHARNKRNSHHGMSFHQFAAKYSNQEAKSVAETAQRTERLRHAQMQAPPAHDPHEPGEQVPDPPESKYHIKKTPLQIFHQDILAQRRFLGRPCNPASKAFWQEVKAEYAELTDEAKEDLHQRSDLTEGPARARRHEKKRRRLAADAAGAPLAAADMAIVPIASDELAVSNLVPFEHRACGCCKRVGVAHVPQPAEALALLLAQDNDPAVGFPTLNQPSVVALRLAPPTDTVPLSVQLLKEALLVDFGQHKISAKRCIKAHQDQSRDVGRDTNAVPKIVDYKLPCSALCRSVFPEVVHHMFAALWARLTTFTKILGGFKEILRRDHVIYFRCSGWRHGSIRRITRQVLLSAVCDVGEC